MQRLLLSIGYHKLVLREDTDVSQILSALQGAISVNSVYIDGVNVYIPEEKQP